MNSFKIVAACSTVAVVLCTTAAGALAGGNSANAKLCQKTGWQGFVTAEGAPFANGGLCVSYAAQGGALRPLTTGGGQ